MHSQSPTSPDSIPWDWIRNNDRRLTRARLFQQWLGHGGEQPVPRKGLGAAPILFVIPEKERTKYTALRPAFILPLQWFAGEQADNLHLPQSLRALAQQVREQVGVRGWFLDFSAVDGWLGQYDLSDWPIDAVSPDSGFVILAASLLLANANIELDPGKALATGCPPPLKERVLRQAEYVADKASVVVELSKRTEKPVILFAAAVKDQHDAARCVKNAVVEMIDLSLPIEQALAGVLAVLTGIRLPISDVIFSEALWDVLTTPRTHPSIDSKQVENLVRERVGKKLAGTPAQGENRELTTVVGQEQAMHAVLEHVERQRNPTEPRSWLPIQGPAGVGKSTLIRHVLRTEKICGQFGRNRYFIDLSKVSTADDAKEKFPRLHDEPTILVLDNLEDVLSADTDRTRELLLRLTHKKNLCLIFTIRREPESWGSIPVSHAVRPQKLTANDIPDLFTPKISSPSLTYLVDVFRGHAQSLSLMANAWNRHQPWTENDFREEVDRDAEQMTALGNGSDASPLAIAVKHLLNDDRLAEGTRAGMILAAFTWITSPSIKHAWLENALISKGHHRLEIKRAIALLREFTLIEKIIGPSSEETNDWMILQNYRLALRVLRKNRPALHADFIECVLLEIEKAATTASEWNALERDYKAIGRDDLAANCRAQTTPTSRKQQAAKPLPKRPHSEQEYERGMEDRMAEDYLQSQDEGAHAHAMENQANRIMVEAAEEKAFMNYGQDMAGQIHLHEEEWDESSWLSDMNDAEGEYEYWAEWADAVVNDELWELYDEDDDDASDGQSAGIW